MDPAADLAVLAQRMRALDALDAVPARAASPEDAATFVAGVASTAAAPARLGDARLDALVNDAARREGIDPALVRAVVMTESGGNPNATSPAGAQGLMQLMPATATALGVRDPYDAAQNVAGGTRYLAQMLHRFDGDERRAVAAYNAGPGAVERYGGVPPYAETQAYVARVLARRG